ncbi:MAG: DUF5011 domain-containing protein [Lachnospira sp.]|nr:DUF5011 domain-containing protein [Lachnospira sp.]
MTAMYYKSRRTTLKSIVKNKMFGVYVLILLLFIIAIVFLINSIKADKTENTDATSQQNTDAIATTKEQTSTESPTSSQTALQYMIEVNTALNYVQIYKLDLNNQYTIPFKTMRCSVSKNLVASSSTLESRYIWKPIDNGLQYAQYVSKTSTNIQFQSCPYTAMEYNKLNTKIYNNLGKSIDIENEIYLYVADAKWIYTNCSNGTPIRIINTEVMPEYVKLQEHKALPELLQWEPTDPNSTCYLKNSIGRIEGVPSTLRIPLGGHFGYTVGVKAYDSENNDVSNQLVVRGRVYNNKIGTYRITYILVDKNCEYILKTTDVTVYEPVIEEEE